MSQEIKLNPEASIKCRLSLDSVEQLLENEEVFAVVSFDTQCAASGVSRHLNSGLPAIDQPGLKEVWSSNQPVKHGIREGFYWSSTDNLLIAALCIEESKEGCFSREIEQSYDRLLAFVKSLGYSNLIRVWNHFSGINLGSSDQERYKQFCQGRHNAFIGAGFSTDDFPPASAVGHAEGEGIIYMIASKNAGVHFDNPQQTSPYCYPRAYGPKSPSFARATYYSDSSGGVVFLSGTASIIGHDTRSKGDLAGQLNVTLENLDKLVASILKQTKISGVLKPDVIKVYIRHPEHVGDIRDQILQHYGELVQVAYLRADICRTDLLVEIEAVCHLDDGIQNAG